MDGWQGGHTEMWHYHTPAPDSLYGWWTDWRMIGLRWSEWIGMIGMERNGPVTLIDLACKVGEWRIDGWNCMMPLIPLHGSEFGMVLDPARWIDWFPKLTIFCYDLTVMISLMAFCCDLTNKPWWPWLCLTNKLWWSLIVFYGGDKWQVVTVACKYLIDWLIVSWWNAIRWHCDMIMTGVMLDLDLEVRVRQSRHVTFQTIKTQSSSRIMIQNSAQAPIQFKLYRDIYITNPYLF